MAARVKSEKNTDRRATREKIHIHKLLTEIENRFESESGKASVGDYIRLLQLERELEEDRGPGRPESRGSRRSDL
jgi:hypothetical protein